MLIGSFHISFFFSGFDSQPIQNINAELQIPGMDDGTHQPLLPPTVSAAAISTDLQLWFTGQPGSTSEKTNEMDLVGLHFLHHRSFSSACGIAFHKSEPIYRLITAPHASPSAGGSNAPTSLDDSLLPRRTLYQVGSHIVFEPPAIYCSCGAFRFRVAGKQDSRLCKHVLALVMALKVEAANCVAQQAVDGSAPSSAIITKVITDEMFVQLCIAA